MSAGQGPLRVIFAGGGTGGHLYPALAIAGEIRRMRPGAEIEFVGTRGRIEERVVPASGYRITMIWISGFRRGLHISALLFPLKVVVALLQSITLLRRVRPQVVVGTGGYVSGPVLYAATLLRIPTIVQEQNSVPGVTTRLLASRVDEVHIAFKDARRYLKRKDNVRCTGNPTRSEMDGIPRERGASGFGLDASLPTLLVIGGSQGSVGVNSALLQALKPVVAAGAQILWQTGDRDFDRISADPRVRDVLPGGRLHLVKFIERMGDAFAASDLVLCRAGAMTLAELTRIGKPSVLIPLPSAAADHQTGNARSMEEAGAAVMVPEREAGEMLGSLIPDLLRDRNRLLAMADRARSLGKADAGRELAAAVIARAEG